MPDSLSPAASGRAKCRGCGGAIAKGELRFGESIPNAYGEGDTSLWFHVHCAALMRPEKFGPLAEDPRIPEEQRGELAPFTASGIAHHRLSRVARAERASSGRAHCRHCRELIEKGALRIGLQLLEETRMTPIGFIHVACSNGYFGTRDSVLERVRKLGDGRATSDEPEFVTELAKESPPSAPRETAGVEPGPGTASPGLAKTKPDVGSEGDAAEDVPRSGSG